MIQIPTTGCFKESDPNTVDIVINQAYAVLWGINLDNIIFSKCKAD